MRYSLVFLFGLLTATNCLAGGPVILEQVISRHDTALNVARARLAVGRDGYVYLGSDHNGGGYVLRVSPDGRTRTGGKVGYSFMTAAANKEGIVATAESHFAHRTAFWNRDFAVLGQVTDFLVNDAVQWNAPSDICAGESGSFYAIDQHRRRIVKVMAPDKLAASFSLEQLGVQPRGASVGLRVDERNKRFLVAWRPGDAVWAIGLDGKPLWKVNVRPAGESPGGFDLDADGKLYVISDGQETVRIFDLDGKPAGEVKLKNDPARKLPPIHDLRVLGSELIVKRSDPTTLFEVYDRTTGQWKRQVRADVDVLTVRYPSDVWTESRRVPFDIHFDAGSRPAKPQFRVFLRPLGVPEFTELALKDGAVTPPAGSRGLYQVRVTPDIRGRVADTVLDGFVEVRTPNAVGSVAIFTPLNRFYYGKNEDIPVSVVLRAPKNVVVPVNVRVVLKGPTGVVLEQPVNLKGAKAEFTIPAKQTEQLKPGRYVLDADVPRFTVASQYLEIGPGLGKRPIFRIVQHGDYSLGFPPGPRPHEGNLPRLIDIPETVADHLERSRHLGLNLFVDRLGHPSNGLGGLGEIARADELIARLKADPIAIAPEKASFEGSIRRTVAGYGAFGIEKPAILLYMDASLPIGPLSDGRKPEKMDADLKQASELLRHYPAFRGWSWAANWWLKDHGAQAAKDDAEKAGYTAALKKAKDTGAWSPVLDAVSNRTFAHAVNAEKRFRSILNGVAPGKLSVMTGPYRAIQTHPPIIFANADEVDLHYQSEQIQPPQVTPHHVDFYKRPGKRAWAHPEFQNDDGTGGMIFPTQLQMVMRGVDGVGQSGPVGLWGGRQPNQSDSRSGAAGITSAHRALYELLERDGPWLRTLENADQLAIVVSTRMQRIETWDGKIGSAYFDTLFEAYNACLYAHRPASFVFVEDLEPASLQRFKAILIAGQQVEIEPPLLAALREAQKNGVKVFHDGTCRPELVKEFLPLGVAFDRVKSDPSAWQDDAAYYRFPRYFKDHAEVLKRVLGSVAPPVAECANPEIMLTERKSADGRYIWAVNNTMHGKRIAVGSELGSLIILNRSGAVLAERDLLALPVPLWLAGGDLLAATWMGQVVRFDSEMKPRWQRKLAPSETDARSKLLARDATPIVRKTGWGNATASTLPLSPNLLVQTKAIISALYDPKSHGDPRPWQNKIEILTDGKPDAPPLPWLSWTDIGNIESGWHDKLTLEVDAFRTQLRLQAVTFVEDPAHPESWLRDMRLEWWDARAEVWRRGPYLLSNAPRHSHTFAKPIEAAKFRFVTSGGAWPSGNIRLSELVFHGQILGPSHPDAVAQKPVAVLFDENESDLRSLKHPHYPFDFRYTDAFSGGKRLELKKAGKCVPEWRGPFHHSLPNWDFEIAENPRPGQYRYLRFAWKASSAQTTGISLLLGRDWPSVGVAVSVGSEGWKEGATYEQRIAGMPPADWQEVTIDLWTATKGKPPRIQALSLLSTGGGALFDRIVLARTLADLSGK